MPAAESPVGQKAPTVTVVIPAYNYSHFLPEAVDSALLQTFPPLEILIIDDGSTDNTVKIVTERFGTNTRVRYIHQLNAGLSAARNTGIKNARGELVAFLDADDMWKPTFLEEIMSRYARLPAEFAIVACRSQLVSIGGDPLPRKKIFPFEDREFSCADILLKTRFAPSSAVVRRPIFDEVGLFDTSLRSSEDRDMWIRIAARHRIFYIGQQLILVRRHGSSMSAHTDRMKQNTRRTFEKARNNPDLAALPPTLWRKSASFFRFETACMYFEEGRRFAALRDLSASLWLWPWFSNPRDLNEPVLFRLRTFKHLLFAPNRHRK